MGENLVKVESSLRTDQFPVFTYPDKLFASAKFQGLAQLFNQPQIVFKIPDSTYFYDVILCCDIRWEG